MRGFLNKFRIIVNKIGVHNFILIVFIVFVLVITNIYQTFSLYTEIDGVNNVNNIKTYNFILNSSNNTNSIVIAPGNSKHVDITISNDGEINLKYLLYYSSDSEDIDIGYLSTNNFPNGIINSNSNLVVSIAVNNLSSNNVKIDFGVNYGFENGDDIILEDDQNLLSEFRNIRRFSDVANPGSYVLYTGNNGCEGESCAGQNANYVDNSDMGYCSDPLYKYNVSGWRVGYVEDGSVYLISAGAIECFCTNADETTSNTQCSSYFEADNLYKHVNNINNVALKYCNSDYSKGGVCDNTTAWVMTALDYEKIVGNASSAESCYLMDEEPMCGYGNSLIDNGGSYWIATVYSGNTRGLFIWHPGGQGVHIFNSSLPSGVRPVLALDSSVVVSGTGTEDDPYVIYN